MAVDFVSEELKDDAGLNRWWWCLRAYFGWQSLLIPQASSGASILSMVFMLGKPPTLARGIDSQAINADEARQPPTVDAFLSHEISVRLRDMWLRLSSRRPPYSFFRRPTCPNEM